MEKAFVAAVVLFVFGSLALAHVVDAGDIVEEPFPLKQVAVAKAVHDVFEAAEQGDADRLEARHLYGPKFSKSTTCRHGRDRMQPRPG